MNNLKIFYHSVATVDCTADPHVVHYPELQRATEDIIKVLESPLVHSVRVVTLYTDKEETQQKSDRYSLYNFNNRRKKASGPEITQHKIAGLYFEEDPIDIVKRPNMVVSDVKEGDKKFFVSDNVVWEKIHYPPERHLPPGLTGARSACKKVLEHPENFTQLQIGVVWKAFMSHSCSDYITLTWKDGVQVDYSNQDEYVGMDTYHGHIEALGELLGDYGNEVEEYNS